MKKVLFSILLCLLLSCGDIWAQSMVAQRAPEPPSPPRRPTVAVVLSGGGAKGCAHVGVLRALEQMQVPIDMVVGTSMGALVGGLYSIGYKADLIDSILNTLDWDPLLLDKQDPSRLRLDVRENNRHYFVSWSLEDWKSRRWSSQGLVKGNNLQNLFSQLTLGYHDSISFDSLPIPYACVAADLVSDSQVNFHSGCLQTAMRASMSIPGVFSPVLLGDMVLVDGGIKDNFPVDVARAMGADYVIGVSVRSVTTRNVDDFRNTLNVMSAISGGLTEAGYDENIDDADVFIKVNVDGYSTMSFNREAIDTLVLRGYAAAMGKEKELRAIQRRVALFHTQETPTPIHYTPIGRHQKLKVDSISFHNVYHFDSLSISRHFLKGGRDSLSLAEIEDIMSTMRTYLFYNNVSYMLHNPTGADGKGATLVLNTEGKQVARIFLGMRYDNIDRVAMQLQGIIPIRWQSFPLMLQPTLRLGRSQDMKLKASITPLFVGDLSLSYRLHHNEMNIYQEGTRVANVDYRLSEVDLGIKSHQAKNLLVDAYLRWNHVAGEKILADPSVEMEHMLPGHLFTYSAGLRYNNQDDGLMATRGTDFMFRYSLHTDDFLHYEGGDAVRISQLSFGRTFPLSAHWYFEPMVYERHIRGDAPALLRNYIGGEYFGHALDQVMPFAGVGNVEVVANTFAAVQAEVRYRFAHSHCVAGTVAMGNAVDRVEDLLSRFPMLGVRLKYTYSTIIGPIGLSVNFSSLTQRLSLYANIGFEF